MIRSIRTSSDGNTKTIRFGTDDVRDLRKDKNAFPADIYRVFLSESGATIYELRRTSKKASTLAKGARFAGRGFPNGSVKCWVEIRSPDDRPTPKPPTKPALAEGYRWVHKNHVSGRLFSLFRGETELPDSEAAWYDLPRIRYVVESNHAQAKPNEMTAAPPLPPGFRWKGPDENGYSSLFYRNVECHGSQVRFGVDDEQSIQRVLERHGAVVKVP